MTESNQSSCNPVDISESDVISAMKEIQGYIDIAPSDFKEVFQIAYAHAMRRIMKSRTAGDIMSRPVACIQSSMDMIDAIHFLAGKHFSGAPVVDASGKIVGVLSEKDFLRKIGLNQPNSFMEILSQSLNRHGRLLSDLHNHAVGEIMSTPPITAGPEMTMDLISSLFLEVQINRLPIVDAAGRPIGIVTRTNLVQSYCALQRGSLKRLRADAGQRVPGQR